MPEINPLTKDQLFEKKIAENTGSNYNVGDISDVVPVTKDQSLLKEIALNSAGLSEEFEGLSEKVNRGSVSVTADGVKTYTVLFNELFALIDVNKISHQSRLRLGNAYISISQIANYFVFDGMVDFMVTGKIFAYSIYLKNNDSVFMETEISTSQTLFTNHSSEAVPSGQVIRLYY